MMPPQSPEPDEYNWDKLGLRPHKHRHELYAIDVEVYKVPVSWFARQLVVMGYEPKTCMLIPERESWFYYDGSGEHIFTIAHAQMEHVWDMLRGTFEDGA